MGTPATFGTPGSAAGDFDVTVRPVAETGRTGVRRVLLPVAFAALAILDLRLGPFPTVDREGLADVLEFLDLPTGAAPDKSLVSVVSISSRLAAFFLPAVLF